MTPEAAANEPFDERYFLDVPQLFQMRAPGEVTARMLADSLLGLEGLAKHSAEFLEAYLEIKINRTEVIIRDVEIGSIQDSWIFRLFFGKGRGAEKKFEAFRAKLGLKEMTPEKLAGLGMMACVAYAALKMVPAAPAPAAPGTITNIVNSFNTIGEGLQMPMDEVVEMLAQSIKNPEELKRDTVRLVNPDGQVRRGKIIFNQDEATTLGEEILELIPAKYERADDEEEPMRDYPAEEVSIRAMDLDKVGKGWWALAPAIADRRLPIELGPGIDPLTIPYGRTIKADLTLTYKVDRNGNRTPKGLMLKRLVKDAPAAVAAE